MNRIFLIIFFLAAFFNHAQEKLKYVFDHLTYSNGLPVKNVQKLVKDKNGVMWMITEKGLLRYNGSGGKIYAPTKDSTGLLPLPMYNLYADKEGLIWIGYLEVCVTSFNPKTEKFTHYYYKKDCKDCFPQGGANKFCEDSKGNFWIAVWGGGLSKFDRKTGKFFTYEPDTTKDNTISTNSTTDIVEWKNGLYLIGSWESGPYGGYNFLQTFDAAKGEFKKFPVNEYTFDSKEEKTGICAGLKIIQFIYPEGDNIWVGTYLGLVCIDTKSKTIKRYSGYADAARKKGINVAYENGRSYIINGRQMWMASEATGIMVIDMDTKKCSYINYDYNNAGSISSDNIFSIYKDDDNNIWVATNGGGIDVYSPIMQQFKFYGNDKLQARKANRAQGQSSVLNVIISKYNNNVYLSHGDGFSILNSKTDSVELIKTSLLVRQGNVRDGIKQEGEAYVAKSLVEVSPDRLFVHAGPYAFFYNIKTKQTKFIRELRITSLSQRNADGIICITGHTGTFATSKFYVVLLDTKEEKIIEMMELPKTPHSDLMFLEEQVNFSLDNDNFILHQNRSIFSVFNSKSKTFKEYTSRNGLDCFPDSMLSLFTVDSKGYAWIKGGSGIYRFDYRSGKTEKYNQKFGFDRENVMSVTEDKDGILWVALKSDLIRYNPETGERLRITKRLGLNAGIFSILPSMQQMSGDVYIAGAFGLVRFNPEALRFKFSQPDLFITSVIVNKDTLTPLALDSFMHFPPQLEWNKNFLTFEFATSQYYTPGPKAYRYRLLGLDSAWYNNENRNYVSYTNLAPGNYTLEIICKNVYGIDSKMSSLPFQIKLPFWKTWWFILISIVVAIAFTGAFFRYRLRKLHADKLKLEKIVDERTKEIRVQSVIIQEKNKELTDSIKYAERIQKVLLANKEVMKAGLPAHFIYFQPKDIVSGDFYWATSVTGSEQITDNKKPITNNQELFYLAVCDSTGHGVPGAFMSLLNISFLNEAINEKKITSSEKILNYVREKLISNVSVDGARDGMDGTVLCYDKAAKKLLYASAHNKPVLIREEKLIELPADKMPIGAGEKADSFTLHTVELRVGDRIYFYTDGYADQFGGPKGKKFKYKQLNEVLLQNNNESPEKQHQILESKFCEWRNNLEQIDDVLVVGIIV